MDFFSLKHLKKKIKNKFHFIFKAIIEPKYIGPLMQLTFIGQVKSELECIYACLTFFQCIQYNLNSNDGSCYLATEFDPLNGSKDTNTISKFIKCNLFS